MSELIHTLEAWAISLSWGDRAVLLIVLIMHRVVSMAGMWPYAIFTLVGTLCHECLHYLFSALLGSNPSFPNLIPERTATGWRMGFVTFNSHFFRNVPIALAPFLLAPLALWWSAQFLHPATSWHYPLHAWIAGTLLFASLPSKQDWKIAMPALLLCGAAWAAFHFRHLI